MRLSSILRVLTVQENSHCVSHQKSSDAFELKYESSRDEDEKEEGMPMLPEAPLTRTYESMLA